MFTQDGLKILARSSVCTLPLPKFNFKVPAHIVRPDMEGWIILDQAEMLDEQLRQKRENQQEDKP